jgi:hypothetical protein
MDFRWLVSLGITGRGRKLGYGAELRPPHTPISFPPSRQLPMSRWLVIEKKMVERDAKVDYTSLKNEATSLFNFRKLLA